MRFVFLKHFFIKSSYINTFNNDYRALDMVTQHFGSVAASTVRNLDIERFPLVALAYRLRGVTEIFQVRNYLLHLLDNS